MQANNAAEPVVDRNAESGTPVSGADRLRTAAALISLSGNLGNDKVNNTIEASIAFAFYQSKNKQRTSLILATDDLRSACAERPDTGATPEG
jgi:hypothetical protein